MGPFYYAIVKRDGSLTAQCPALAGQTVIIRERKAQRSLNQNAYLHAEPFLKLAAAWGESVARTKLVCMGEFWGYEPCKRTGLMLPVKAHTSDMSVQECKTFIDWLIPWSNEEGVDVEEPRRWQE